jgi:hypothetical protein
VHRASLILSVLGCSGAVSSEVATGSRRENASNQEAGAPFRLLRNGKAPGCQGFLSAIAKGFVKLEFFAAIGSEVWRECRPAAIGAYDRMKL